jgi:hypothetical protein
MQSVSNFMWQNEGKESVSETLAHGSWIPNINEILSHNLCIVLYKVIFPPNLIATNKSSYGGWSRKLCVLLPQIIDSNSESNWN